MKSYIFILIILLWSCGHHQEEHPQNEHREHNHEHAEEHEEEHNHDVHENSSSEEGNHDTHSAHEDHNDEGKIVFPKYKSQNIDFEIQTIRKNKFSGIIKTSGEILPAQGDEQKVTAISSGTFTFGKEILSLGKKINKGDILGYVINTSLSENTNEEFLNTQADYQKAKRDYERSHALFTDSILPEQDFIAIKLAYTKAQNALNKYLSNSSENGIAIKASASGYLKDLYVSEGIFVEEGQAIASIAQNRRLIIQIDISPKYASELPKIVSANFKTTYSDKVFNTKQLNGKILSWGKSLSNHALIPVQFEIDNKYNLIPGSFIEAWLLTLDAKEIIAIPNNSIIEQQGKYFVFIQESEEHFEKRPIEIGLSNGERTHVISGVHSGEKIVSKGALHLKLASIGTALPAHGHSH